MNRDCKAKKGRQTKLDEWNQKARSHGLSYGQYVALRYMIHEGQRIRMPTLELIMIPVRVSWKETFEEGDLS